MFGFNSYTPITIGGLTYLGVWDASANSPFLTSSVGGASGDYYVVSVAGTTNLNGINDWEVGDWALFNGSAWQKIDNSDIVGIQSLNGLTFNTQTFDVATSGLDFNISSSGSIHTFNLPTASATNRGALSSTDWSTFNGKQNTITTGTTAQYFRGDLSLATFPTIPTVVPSSLTKTDDTNVTLTLGGTPSTALLEGVSLTLGWTGTLADSRITSASTWNSKIGGSGTINEISYFTASGTIASLTTATYPSLTELSYVKGLTSSAQTQINSTYVPRVQSVTSSATVTPTNLNDEVIITAQAVGLTLANPTGSSVEGQSMIIRIKDNGVAQTIGYGTEYRAIGVTLPTTTVISKTLYLGLIRNATDSTWDVIGYSIQA